MCLRRYDSAAIATGHPCASTLPIGRMCVPRLQGLCTPELLLRPLDCRSSSRSTEQHCLHCQGKPTGYAWDRISCAGWAMGRGPCKYNSNSTVQNVLRLLQLLYAGGELGEAARSAVPCRAMMAR